jgi:hypothetical protein
VGKNNPNAGIYRDVVEFFPAPEFPFFIALRFSIKKNSIADEKL